MLDLIPSPDPSGLPAPPWLLAILLVVTQSLHVIFMNFVLGGNWFLIFLSLDTKTEWKRVLYDRSLRVMPVAISMAITFGVAPLLFVQVLYGQFFYTANVLMGAFWLAVTGILVTAFYGIYLIKAQRVGYEDLGQPEDWVAPKPVRVAGHVVLALMFTSIAVLFTTNATLAVSPHLWEAAHDGNTLLAVWTGSGFFLPRFLHNFVGSLGVTGLWLVWIANFPGKPGAEPGARAGAVLAVSATIVQMGIGLWYLLSLPSGLLQSMLNLESLGSTHLMTGIFLAFFLFFAKAFLVLMPTVRGLRWTATVLEVLVILTMITVSEGLRRLLLEDHFSFEDFAIVSQTGPLVIFLLLFVGGVLTVGWIAWILWKAHPGMLGGTGE